MATIRASCEFCGDVELTTADVHVRVCTLDSQGTYSFRCPTCDMTVVKPAEARTVDLLVASGVSYSTLGYGDVVLPQGWRTLGPAEGLTGILMCGLSTGLFFAIAHRLLEARAHRRANPPG